VRITRGALVLAAVTVLCGCGDRRLIVNVDVLSYLDPSQTQAEYGPVPAAPGGWATGEQPLVDDLQVNMLDGLNGTVDVQAVSIRIAEIVRDSTGSGSDTLRLYASDTGTSPTSTTPILVQVIPLAPGISDTLTAEVEGDARVAKLFASRAMRVSVTTSLRGPSSGAALNGSVRLSRLDATVITRRTGL
jgi:hypothetical protein